MNGGDSDHGLTRIRRMLVVFDKDPKEKMKGISKIKYKKKRQGFK